MPVSTAQYIEEMVCTAVFLAEFTGLGL